MIRRIASCTGGALHKSAFSDETALFHSAMKHFRFRSNMKHSAYAAYDEKMKNGKIRFSGGLRTFTDSDGPDRLLRCAKK